VKDSNDIVRILSKFMSDSPLNKVEELNNMIIFDEPLVAIASADDILFQRLKETVAVGEHHLTPMEWLPEAKTVISYFLPFSPSVRESNYRNDERPSREWLYGRIEGENLNNAMKDHLAEKIKEADGKVLIPPKDSRCKTIDNRSSWSERHIAYIAGLGTFSLSKSIITKKGCAGRFSSIITNLPLVTTEHNYHDLYGYCNQCGVCIDRCPVQAITREGKKHPPCEDFINKTKVIYSPRYGCGKCQTAVPCEAGIPVI